MRFGTTIAFVLALRFVAIAQPDKPKPLPDISLNIGYVHGFTDVALGNGGPSAIGQLGYQLHISQQIVPGLNGTFALFTGKIRGDQTQGTENVNFSSSLFSQTIGLEYSFQPLLKPDHEGRQLVRPFIGVGFGAIQFRSKADLKDAQGRTYYWWDDGKIYDQPQNNYNPDNVVELTRDFEYDTDLRDLNRDGLGKYSQVAFTMPLSAGVRFQFGKHIGVNASVSYMINFTNLIDDVSLIGPGVRTSGGSYDNNLFASVGLTVFMGRTQPRPKPTPNPVEPAVAQSKPEPLASQTKPEPSKQTETTNGRTEPTPQSANNNTTSATNENGPSDGNRSVQNNANTTFDQTQDPIKGGDNPSGHGNLNQTATETALGASEGLSNENKNQAQIPGTGQAKTGQVAESSKGAQGNDNQSSESRANKDGATGANSRTNPENLTPSNSNPSSNSGATDNKNSAKTPDKPSKTKAPDPLQEALKQEALITPPKPTSRYHWADLDSNGRITPDEVIHFIDQLFEGNGKQSVQDIQDLIEYYFDQGE